MQKQFTHLKTRLKYDDLLVENATTGRTYLTPTGSRYPSITTVLGILSEDSIRKWRERVGAEEANRISRKAASRGTNLHLVAEKYIDNDPDYIKGHMPHVVELFKSIQPILDERINNIRAQEIALYSDMFQIAGRVDCIGELDGVLTVIDYKTSSKPKEYSWISSYFMQAAFYSAAYYEATDIPIQQSAIIIAVEGSEPQVFIEPTFPWLKQLKSVRNEYRNRKGI
jgi:CRISPR/Cas system-associated exonuclease Cas4 (RecB family)